MVLAMEIASVTPGYQYVIRDVTRMADGSLIFFSSLINTSVVMPYRLYALAIWLSAGGVEILCLQYFPVPYLRRVGRDID